MDFVALPVDAAMDGDPREWSGLPTAALGSARVWCALDASGLTVAAAGAQRVEISLAFPPADPVSPTAGIDPWNASPLASDAACADVELDDGIDRDRAIADCCAWYATQSAFQGASTAAFAHFWSFDAVPTAAGWSLEAQVPASSLPFSAEVPLVHVRLELAVINDAGDRVSTGEQTVVLSAPVGPRLAPVVLAALARSPGSWTTIGADPGVVYSPDPGWWSPTSATDRTVRQEDLGRPTLLATLPDGTEIREYPAGYEPFRGEWHQLVTVRDGAMVDRREGPNGTDRVVVDGDRARVVTVDHPPTTGNPMGYCGGCDNTDGVVRVVDPGGAIRDVGTFGGEGWNGEPPVAVNADLTLVRSIGDATGVAAFRTHEVPTGEIVALRWDAAAATFRSSSAQLADHLCDAGEAVVRSCVVESGKTASVCGSGDRSVYRFGTPAKVEIELTSNKRTEFAASAATYYPWPDGLNGVRVKTAKGEEISVRCLFDAP